MTDLVLSPLVPTPRLPSHGEVVPLPRVVPGEVVWDVQDCTARPVYNRPYAPPWAITDPGEIDAMRARIKWHRAPFWWRAFHPRPPEPTHLTPTARRFAVGEDLIQMRLVRSDRHLTVSEWEQHVDTRDGDKMRDALIGAVKGHVGEAGDWKSALPLHHMLWRWGSSCGWRTFRAAK